MDITLNASEMAELLKQDPATGNNGGWQHLLVSLQRKLNRITRQLHLTDDDIEKIGRYAHDYGNGGWESTLLRIFRRHLGPNLDGTPETK